MRFFAEHRITKKRLYASRAYDLAIDMWGRSVCEYSYWFDSGNGVEHPLGEGETPPSEITLLRRWLVRKVIALTGGQTRETKPPLGLMPRKIWREKRERDILAAMRRYAEAGKPIPVEWLDELIELQ